MGERRKGGAGVATLEWWRTRPWWRARRRMTSDFFSTSRLLDSSDGTGEHAPCRPNRGWLAATCPVTDVGAEGRWAVCILAEGVAVAFAAVSDAGVLRAAGGAARGRYAGALVLSNAVARRARHIAGVFPGRAGPLPGDALAADADVAPLAARAVAALTRAVSPAGCPVPLRPAPPILASLAAAAPILAPGRGVFGSWQRERRQQSAGQGSDEPASVRGGGERAEQLIEARGVHVGDLPGGTTMDRPHGRTHHDRCQPSAIAEQSPRHACRGERASCHRHRRCGAARASIARVLERLLAAWCSWVYARQAAGHEEAGRSLPWPVALTRGGHIPVSSRCRAV